MYPMEKHIDPKTKRSCSTNRIGEILHCLFLLESRTQSFAWEKKKKKSLNEWVFFSIVVYAHNLAMHLLATVIIKQALTINKETMKMKVVKWK